MRDSLAVLYTNSPSRSPEEDRGEDGMNGSSSNLWMQAEPTMEREDCLDCFLRGGVRRLTNRTRRGGGKEERRGGEEEEQRRGGEKQEQERSQKRKRVSEGGMRTSTKSSSHNSSVSAIKKSTQARSGSSD